MTEGKIVSWLKQAGDKVKKGEVSERTAPPGSWVVSSRRQRVGRPSEPPRWCLSITPITANAVAWVDVAWAVAHGTSQCSTDGWVMHMTERTKWLHPPAGIQPDTVPQGALTVGPAYMPMRSPLWLWSLTRQTWTWSPSARASWQPWL